MTTEVDGPRRRCSGELSGLVLDILRRAGTAMTPTAVQHQLIDRGAGDLAYTTVVTILSRLHEQGFAERFRAGRSFAYLAVADVTLAADRMRRVLDDQHTSGERDAVLARFVHDLSTEDEQRLRVLLGDLSAYPAEAPARRGKRR